MEIQSALIGAGAAMGLTACLLSACSTIGTGRSTLVLATPQGAPAYRGQEFNQFVATRDRQVVGLEGKRPLAQPWSAFKAERYGDSGLPIARIDVNVRDQTTTPALDLFNIATANAGDVAKVLADKTLTPDQKNAILTSLQDAYRQLPESASRLVLSRMDPDGKLVYNYYPTITVDLTGVLNSPEPSDRFDMVAVAIRIPETSPARFINFSPKAADLFDFTLGTLKQSASATGALTAGDTLGTSASATRTPTPASSSATGSTGSLALNGSLTATASDEFTRDLKGSLEARSTGIFEGGKLFVAQLRANDQRRIAGTYTFEIMLEIPSTVKVYEPPPGTIRTQQVMQSEPDVASVLGEVRTMALVRHVKRFGQTGLLKRVPEPLNDDVFQEALIQDSQASLWTFNNIPTGTVAPITNLKVFTNQDDASFSVYDSGGVLLKRGSGRTTELALATTGLARVVFDPIVGASGVELTPPQEATVAVGPTAAVVGNYRPKPQQGAPHGE